MAPPPRSLGEISASPLQPRLAVSPEWRGGPVSPTLTCATITVGPGPHRRSVQVSDALWLFPGIGSGSGARGGCTRQSAAPESGWSPWGQLWGGGESPSLLSHPRNHTEDGQQTDGKSRPHPARTILV